MNFAQSSAVYFNYSLEYAIRDLHRLGYEGIEIWGGRPHMYRTDLEVEPLVSLLRSLEMHVCNLIPAQFRYPSLLCSDNEEVRRDSVSYIVSAMRNAVAVGSPSVSLCPGMVLWDHDLEVGRRQLRTSMLELAEINAAEFHLKLLIEPAHRYETNLLLTVEQTIEFIDSLDSMDFGILIDTGHCNVNGEDLAAAIKTAKNLPLHVHVDDNHGDVDAHLVPGEGSIDFSEIPAALDAIGYRGFLSAELGPRYIMNPGDACRQTLEWFRNTFTGSQSGQR